MFDCRDSKNIVNKVRELMTKEGIRYSNKFKKYYYSGYGDNLFDWELYFDTIVLLYFKAEQYAINGLHIFLDSQKENGFIPRRIYMEDDREAFPNAIKLFEDEEHCKPFLSQIALLITRARQDISWLSESDIFRLVKYMSYWLSSCDIDGNGLSEWNSAPHTGADTQFERVGVWRSYFCEGVDLNCYLYKECLALAELCKTFGFREWEIYFHKEAENKRKKIQEFLWDKKDGLFYDRDIRTGRNIRVKSASMFIPLWAGIATEEQALLLVERHLKNPNEFWINYPIPSYASSEPYYTQTYRPAPGTESVYTLREGHCNWCGGLWPHWEYLITHGLKNYNYNEEALYIAKKFYEVSINNPSLYEWYNAETGEGQGGHPFVAGISILGLFLPLELELEVKTMEIVPIQEELDISPIREKLRLETLPNLAKPEE
ncbi:TPA: hypothetical protein GXX44_02435 [bacterium]|nr:hypothetical protein [bacterium]